MHKDSLLKPLINHLKLKQGGFFKLPTLGHSQLRNKTNSDFVLWHVVFPLRFLRSSPRAVTWKFDIGLLSSECWIFLSRATLNMCRFLNFPRKMGYISGLISSSSTCCVALQQRCAYGTGNREHILQNSSK